MTVSRISVRYFKKGPKRNCKRAITNLMVLSCHPAPPGAAAAVGAPGAAVVAAVVVVVVVFALVVYCLGLNMR